jgi:hypothetical protein
MPIHLKRLILAVATMQLIASPVEAQPSPTGTDVDPPQGPGSTGISAWGVVGYGNGLGAGGRFMVPVISEGLLHNDRFKDQLAVEFGVDLLRFSYDFLGDSYGFTEILPVAGFLWNVWLSDTFALYPKLDLGYGVGFITGWEDAWGTHPVYGGFFWQTSVGLIYKTNSVALRLELGHGLLKAGVGFGF